MNGIPKQKPEVPLSFSSVVCKNEKDGNRDVRLEGDWGWGGGEEGGRGWRLEEDLKF